MSFFDNKIAERLGGEQFGKSTDIYKFERIKRAKSAAKKANSSLPLIDMGVGEPDWAADELVVTELAQQAGKPENRWYADNGILEFQEAAAEYMDRVYGVSGLSVADQIVHGIGSKPVLAMLPISFINPGDIILATVPGYPVSSTYTKYLGGEVYNLPLLKQNDFLPALDTVPEEVCDKAKMLYINYPNNPTGAVASREFFEKAVHFAKEKDVLVVHDAAYSGLVFDEYKPLSFLSIDGAMEVGIEIHSLSKAFNMTGWRIGFVCGNAKAVQAYATVKDNTDSGQFRGIQLAAAKALRHPEITKKTCDKYSRRFNLLVKALQEIGFDAKKPKGSFYCYVEAPKGADKDTVFETAADFSDFLIEKSLISTVPWDDAGKFIRFSATFEAKTESEEIDVINEMKKRMIPLNLRF